MMQRVPERWSRLLTFGLSALLLATIALELSIVVPRVLTLQGALGVDFHQYQDHARRWLDGAGFYLPAQLAGPYVTFDLLPPLYPPPFLLLIVPFLWLPELLWWIVPLGVISVTVAWWRPTRWAWVAILVLVAWPRTYEIILFGNPSMWIAAFAAAGTIFAWPYVGILLKPSLAPLALLGARNRSWWMGLAGAALLSLPFGTMWVDYAKAIINADQNWTYSLRDVPIVLIPIVAYLGRGGAKEGIRPHITLRRPTPAP
jgi:hypothetical protein